jgi:hypothetical protein
MEINIASILESFAKIIDEDCFIKLFRSWSYFLNFSRQTLRI